jgi:predicted Zn-dependent protease
VLKALGKLDDALAAYDSIIADHPQDVIAKTGRADVLKALGRLDEALAAYDSVIADHPQNVVAKTGRAEVLKALGKLDDALAAYDSIIADHPQDVVAKNGRAEVLKALGKLDDALAAYDEVITIYPKDPIARNGRSCLLAALKRFDEALESLLGGYPVIEQDWIGYHIRGMITMRMGRLEEAIRIFNEGVNSSPWASSKGQFQSALAIASLKQLDFVKASQVLEQVTAPALQPQVNLLRLHSFGEMGDYKKVVEVYTDLRENPPAFADELTDELHWRYVLNEKPRHDDDWVFYKEVDVVLLGGPSYSSASYYS